MKSKPLVTDPELLKKLAACKDTRQTAAEIEAQRQSWIRWMTAGCEHGELDFEECPKCRTA
jgi:hypothetical protein